MNANEGGGVVAQPVAQPPATGEDPPHRRSLKTTLLALLAVWIGGIVVLAAVYGVKGHRNKVYKPQNEFKLHNYVNLGIFSINQAVLYLFLAGVLTCVTMIYIARRMQQRPNSVQTAVELIFQPDARQHRRRQHGPRMAAKWFPFIATLSLFIFFSNLVGFIPLPTNTEHEINLFGSHIPPFSLYAATANLSIPLVLALVVFVSYTVEGIRAKGPIGYLKGLIPAGVHRRRWPSSSSSSRCSRT